MTTATPPAGPPASPPSPQARRIATPSWLDLRLVLGVVLVLASVLVGARVVASASDTTATVTLTRDLAVGTVISSDDLTLAQVQLPDGRAKTYLSATKKAVGKRLTRAVSRGELLPAAAIAEVRPQTTLTVPLSAGAAPQLRTGQRIELWVSSATCSSVVLLPDVTVQSVRGDEDNSFGGGTGAQNVVISVDSSQAGRVISALAIDGATVRAGVLIGASASPSNAAPSGDTSSAGDNDDLASCASAANR